MTVYVKINISILQRLSTSNKRLSLDDWKLLINDEILKMPINHIFEMFLKKHLNS